MSTKLPYVNQPGSIAKIFEKIRQAQTPERFTGDFLETKLGFRGGNYRQFIPFAKKIGLLGTDGRPTDIYKSYRNAATSKTAMAQALRLGYKELFERNEYVSNLTKDDFKGLVVEITGLEWKSRVVQLVCQTFECLKKLADFEGFATAKKAESSGEEHPRKVASEEEGRPPTRDLDLNLSYTIRAPNKMTSADGPRWPMSEAGESPLLRSAPWPSPC